MITRSLSGVLTPDIKSGTFGIGEEFAAYIQKEQDQRHISGFSSIYCLLRLIQAEKGQVLRYDRGITDQYNSTVTYASMAFF